MSRHARDFRHVPEGSSNAPPLAPDARPHWATARDGSTFVRISLYPRTLNELRAFARGFGRPAAREAEWSCVLTWLMWTPPEADLTNPLDVTLLAVRLVHEWERVRFGWPSHDGKDWPLPALDKLNPEVRPEALLVAAETLSDWRAAGRPHLDPSRIKRVYQRLVSSPAFTAKYLQPLGGQTTQQETE